MVGIMGKIYASANPEMSEREKRNMEKLRKLASQGMVLIKKRRHTSRHTGA